MNTTDLKQTSKIQTDFNADILLVDDTPDNVRFLSRILTEYGYSVRKALNGRMALTAVQTKLPDLILLDIRMPDLDGYEVCQQLKDDPRTAAIPIIFLSAWSETTSKVKAFQMGGVDYITKPFHFEEVIARIETQLTITKLQSQLKHQNDELRQTLHDLHQTQNQLVQEQKMASLGRFVAGVSHEINNPVSFISCNIPHVNYYLHQLSKLIHLYREDYPDPTPRIANLIGELDLDFVVSDFQKILRSIRNGAERIQSIVLALKIFSRLDEAEFKPVDLHEGIDSALTLLNHRLDELTVEKASVSGIQIDKDYGILPTVSCNSRYVNQAIFNLLDNAINALNKQATIMTEAALANWAPTIWIRTYISENDDVFISIKDNGAGIHPEHVPQLFDPFFKGDKSDYDNAPGLGLHTTYQIIVEHHGGHLTCNSAPNEGAEFIIRLPVNASLAKLHQ